MKTDAADGADQVIRTVQSAVSADSPVLASKITRRVCRTGCYRARGSPS